MAEGEVAQVGNLRKIGKGKQEEEKIISKGLDGQGIRTTCNKIWKNPDRIFQDPERS